MNTKDRIIKLLNVRKEIRTRELALSFGVSRQYINQLIAELVSGGKIKKIGSTRSAFYVLTGSPARQIFEIKKRIANKNLREHEILFDIRKKILPALDLKENVSSIFDYAFSEMLNNAIEHSKSEFIEIEVSREDNNLVFIINDFGIGVFRNIMQKRDLKSGIEAIQDLLKGKTTTAPHAHSGEGIFFTSKVADKFILESFEYRLIIDNLISDIFIKTQKPKKNGTRVIFYIDLNTERHIGDIFGKFQTSKENPDFGKTEIQVRLYTTGTIYVSRSQARRLLTGLEKFKVIILDFDKVPAIGQAFADEIFRVFKNKHPHIKIKSISANEAVEFMIKRVGK